MACKSDTKTADREAKQLGASSCLSSLLSFHTVDPIKQSPIAYYNELISCAEKTIGDKILNTDFFAFLDYFPDRKVHFHKPDGSVSVSVRADQLYMKVVASALENGRDIQARIIFSLPRTPEGNAIRKLYFQRKKKKLADETVFSGKDKLVQKVEDKDKEQPYPPEENAEENAVRKFFINRAYGT